MATIALRSGDLDRRVILQQATKSYSPSGEPIQAWATIAQRWAALRILTGDERSSVAQWVAREQVQFTVRWDNAIKFFGPLDRVIFPASDAGASPQIIRSIYDVFAVHELGRHVGLQILAARLLEP